MNEKVELYCVQLALDSFRRLEDFHEFLASETPVEKTRNESLAYARAMRFAIDLIETLIPESKNVPSEASATSVA